MKTLLGLVLTALLLGFAAPGMADTYTQLTLPALNVRIQTWTGGGAYDPIFPSTQTWNGVPFTFAEDASGNQVWMGNMDVPVNVFGATKAYTIMNSAFGAFGSVNGSIEFFGSGDGYYEMDLTQGINIRDH
ncbi:MAG: hypothetical protein HYV93_00920 [Candidatus Rokubacteria bacterium]|nr:hypothetical protein [Candidatus Rokubacteria bacterium]